MGQFAKTARTTLPALFFLTALHSAAAQPPPIRSANGPPVLWFGAAETMPDLDALFQRNDGWIGGDGVYSVMLTPERTLWLFSDTWVGSIRDGKRSGATIVNNTAALQEGHGASARLQFFVLQGADQKPTALLTPADGKGWFWLQAGAVVRAPRAKDRLVMFLAQIEKNGKPGVFGFRQIGTVLGLVSNPYDPPPKWQVEQRKLPCGIFTPQRVLTFGAAVLPDAEFLYVYGTDEDIGPAGPDRYLIVARVPLQSSWDAADWRFYRDGQWVAEFQDASRLVRHMASEASVSYQPQFKRFLLVYTEDGLSPRILARSAAGPAGPWSAATTIYECPEMGRDKRVFTYAAKAHASLTTGNELIVSYVANSFDFWQVAADARLYWPQFVRVPLRGEP